MRRGTAVPVIYRSYNPIGGKRLISHMKVLHVTPKPRPPGTLGCPVCQSPPLRMLKKGACLKITCVEPPRRRLDLLAQLCPGSAHANEYEQRGDLAIYRSATVVPAVSLVPFPTIRSQVQSQVSSFVIKEYSLLYHHGETRREPRGVVRQFRPREKRGGPVRLLRRQLWRQQGRGQS